jgi:hypothetical protein
MKLDAFHSKFQDLTYLQTLEEKPYCEQYIYFMIYGGNAANCLKLNGCISLTTVGRYEVE